MKLKKIIVCVCLLLVSSNVHAQLNLIKDGSFEDTTEVWQNYSCNNTLKHWTTIDTCCVANSFLNLWVYNSLNRTQALWNLRMPQNQWMYQYPQHGISAVGLTNYVDFNIVPPLDKAFGQSLVRGYLKQQLVAGKEYCATIYASCTEKPNYYVTNALDMYFDDGSIDTFLMIHYDSSANYTSVIPQVRCNSLLDDTLNWMKIQGTFIANGTETKLSIGNFRHESLVTKQIIYGDSILVGWTHNLLLDNVSLIPTDIHDWLHDTFCAIGDSVWVGLNQFDYGDGVWYNSNMQVIDTTQGFWYTPEAAVTSFIQGVEVCGTWHYDTMNVYMYPTSSEQLVVNSIQLKVFPNPANESVTISITKLLHKNEPIEIVDATGKVVYSLIPKENIINVDVRSLVSGIYVVRYGGGNVKLVVE